MDIDITQRDLSKLNDFVRQNKGDKESPIVWIAQIVEKLARQQYRKKSDS